MNRLTKVLATMVCVSLLATAAHAIPIISSVVASYPLDPAHPTLTISCSGFGQNPTVTLGTGRLRLQSNSATQLVAVVSGIVVSPGTYRLAVTFSDTLPATFFATIDPPATVDLSALQQQVATLQQQATASQQQFVTLQQQATAAQQQVASLQVAVTQLQAALAAVQITIPANLTALSNGLSTNHGIALNGRTTYVSTACNNLNIGDVYLSVNGYGQGAVPADGSTLNISQYPDLFLTMGTFFGGDGETTFVLPDLRAFAPQGLQYSICTSGAFPPRI